MPIRHSSVNEIRKRGVVSYLVFSLQFGQISVIGGGVGVWKRSSFGHESVRHRLQFVHGIKDIFGYKSSILEEKWMKLGFLRVSSEICASCICVEKTLIFLC